MSINDFEIDFCSTINIDNSTTEQFKEIGKVFTFDCNVITEIYYLLTTVKIFWITELSTNKTYQNSTIMTFIQIFEQLFMDMIYILNEKTKINEKNKTNKTNKTNDSNTKIKIHNNQLPTKLKYNDKIKLFFESEIEWDNYDDNDINIEIITFPNTQDVTTITKQSLPNHITKNNKYLTFHVQTISPKQNDKTILIDHLIIIFPQKNKLFVMQNAINNLMNQYDTSLTNNNEKISQNLISMNELEKQISTENTIKKNNIKKKILEIKNEMSSVHEKNILEYITFVKQLEIEYENIKQDDNNALQMELNRMTIDTQRRKKENETFTKCIIGIKSGSSTSI